MLFNKLLQFIEVILVIVFSLLLFSFYPLATIVLLFIYSVFRSSFYILAIFTFSYDIIYSNLLGGIPKLSLIVLVLGGIVYLARKKLFKTVRGARRVAYDF